MDAAAGRKKNIQSQMPDRAVSPSMWEGPTRLHNAAARWVPQNRPTPMDRAGQFKTWAASGPGEPRRLR